jgi:hypothetical protein
MSNGYQAILYKHYYGEYGLAIRSGQISTVPVPAAI